MYDEQAHMFRAPQIGSFIALEKRYDEYGACLYGTARVNKRNPRVSEAIAELYAGGALNFSFEIEAGSTRVEDGVLIVDADEDNDLTGVAIVSVPAYPESEALSLVAEAKGRTRTMIGSAYIVLPEETDLISIYSKASSAICDYLQIMPHELCLIELRAGYMVFRYGEQDGIYRADYSLSDDHRVLIKDMYEVSYARVEQEGEKMFIEEVAAETIEEVVVEEVNETTVSEETETVVAETEAEETTNEEAETDENTESVTEETVETEQGEWTITAEEVEIIVTEESADETVVETPAESEAEALIAELNQRIAELSESNAQLLAEKTEVENELADMRNEKQEREDRERREQMRVFAEAQGMDLDADTIKNAIDTLNYEFLMAEAAKCSASKVASVTVRMEADMSVKPYGGLLERE